MSFIVARVLCYNTIITMQPIKMIVVMKRSDDHQRHVEYAQEQGRPEHDRACGLGLFD